MFLKPWYQTNPLFGKKQAPSKNVYAAKAAKPIAQTQTPQSPQSTGPTKPVVQASLAVEMVKGVVYLLPMVIGVVFLQVMPMWDLFYTPEGKRFFFVFLMVALVPWIGCWGMHVSSAKMVKQQGDTRAFKIRRALILLNVVVFVATFVVFTANRSEAKNASHYDAAIGEKFVKQEASVLALVNKQCPAQSKAFGAKWKKQVGTQTFGSDYQTKVEAFRQAALEIATKC